MKRPLTLAERVHVYALAALGDVPAFPELAGCTVTGATAADMNLCRAGRDERPMRAVLRAAGVSL